MKIKFIGFTSLEGKICIWCGNRARKLTIMEKRRLNLTGNVYICLSEECGIVFSDAR